MPKNDLMGTLTRALRLFRMLHTEKYVTTQRVAEELEVHPKTVKRYLNTLDAAGFHMDVDTHGMIKPRIRFSPVTKSKAPMELFSFTRDQMIWLYLQLSGVQHAAPPGVREELWERICQALPAEGINRKRLASMLATFEKGYKSYEDEKTRGIIVSLLDALYRERRCRVTYQAPNAPKSRKFYMEPYHLFEFEGGLYCFCHLYWVEDGNRILMLAVERIQALELQEDFFERQPDVLAEIELRKTRAFRITDDGHEFKFKIRFTPDAAAYATGRTWHSSQSKPRKRRDGSVELTFKASGRREIVAWILGWGPACEVLEPLDLREEVEELQKSAWENYQGKRV